MGLLKVLALTSAPAGRRGSGAFLGNPPEQGLQPELGGKGASQHDTCW